VAYGKNSKAVAENRVGGAQTLSGCGAVYMGALFFKRFYPQDFTIYTTTPTWPIHNTLLQLHGVKHKEMPYYNPKTKGLDFEGLMDTINKAPEGQIFMLHSCAHNPTGVDPTPEQWKEIAAAIEKKRHFTFFDMAYQGFASGDLEKDNLTLQLWEKKGLNFCVAQSFAKSMGLYGQRVGTFSIVCENSAEAAQVQSQLATVARNTWSSPPKYGGQLAKTVLANQNMYNQWLADMQLMAGRIKKMRSSLVQKLKEQGSTHDWSHITNQIGMFAYTGLQKEQCELLIKNHSIFLTMNGRISVAGLNEKNVEYVAKCFHEVTKNSKL
jgi:aspartate aminotransferase